VSADSSWELQQAIYNALTGDATLMGMVQGVHDHVPQGAAFPYVTVGEGSARPWRAVGLDGVETTLILHVWSRERGRKQAKQIMAEIHRILDDADLTLSGHVLVSLRFEYSHTVLDADGVTYHGIARYHAMIHTA
jgi:hypothetical protein